MKIAIATLSQEAFGAKRLKWQRFLRAGDEVGCVRRLRLESRVNPLHFGRFGGLATKLVWTAAGLFLAGGILAGSAIWWFRAASS